MNVNRVTVWVLCGLLAAVTACSGRYYRVTDPTSGKAYYTKEVEQAGKAGAVKFTDEKSGSAVTLQSSEVKEISEAEFLGGLAGPANPPGRSGIQSQPVEAK